MTTTHTGSTSVPGDLSRMRADIMDAIDTRERRRTTRHRVVALAASGLVVLGTTAGAFAVTQAPQGQINYTADCYAAADLGSQHGTSLYLPGNQTSPAATPIADRVRLAEGMCATTWQIGTFHKGAVAQGQTFPVPNLVTCQLGDGRLAVFPSDNSPTEVCSTLGLSTPRP